MKSLGMAAMVGGLLIAGWGAMEWSGRTWRLQIAERTIFLGSRGVTWLLRDADGMWIACLSAWPLQYRVGYQSDEFQDYFHATAEANYSRWLSRAQWLYTRDRTRDYAWPDWFGRYRVGAAQARAALRGGWDEIEPIEETK